MKLSQWDVRSASQADLGGRRRNVRFHPSATDIVERRSNVMEFSKTRGAFAHGPVEQKNLSGSCVPELRRAKRPDARNSSADKLSDSGGRHRKLTHFLHQLFALRRQDWRMESVKCTALEIRLTAINRPNSLPAYPLAVCKPD